MEKVEESIDKENRFSNSIEDLRPQIEAENNAVFVAQENISNRIPEEERIAYDLFEVNLMKNILGPNWLLD